MNIQNIKRLITFFSILFVIFFTANISSFASDYQYKVLDPKYNPQAEQLLNGSLSQVPDMEYTEPQKFNFANLFAIFALVVFPIIIISLAVRTFREITDDVPGREKQTLGNITISPDNENITDIDTAEKINSADEKLNMSSPMQNTVPEYMNNRINTFDNTGTRIRPALPDRMPTQSEKLPKTANISISKYFSSPAQKTKNPVLLNTSLLSKNKGLCLVEYNKKYSLIGYINNEIFMLNQFDNIKSREIRSRLSESVDSKDKYIVKLGDYKALVEVTDTKMDLLLEL